MNETFYVVSVTAIPVLLLGIRIQMFVAVQSIQQETRLKKKQADRIDKQTRRMVSASLWVSPVAMAMGLFGATGIPGPTTSLPLFDFLFTYHFMAPVIGGEIVLLCVVAAMHPLLQLAGPIPGVEGTAGQTPRGS